MSFTDVTRFAPRSTWTVAQAACLALIAATAFLGLLVWSEIPSRSASEDDAVWSAFELGYEHQRLLLAAEKGESLEDIKLRGEIYLSRVIVLRDAPALAEVRQQATQQDLTALYQSAQETDLLLQGLESLDARDGLLDQLRTDSRMIRELMLAIMHLDRRLHSERHAEKRQTLMYYLVALELLMVALLALSAIVFRTTRKLGKAGRELASQLAQQDAILKSVDSAIVGLGAREDVLYSNRKAHELLGPGAWKGADILGPAIPEGSLLAEIRILLDDAWAAAPSTACVTRKVRVVSGEGPLHYVIGATRTAPPAEGEATPHAALILSVRDVTSEEEAAQRREEYDHRLNEASRLLAYASVSGGIVHEISQPLAAIRNYVYALKLSMGFRDADEEQLAVVARLGEEVDRAIEVVRNVRRMGPQDPQDGGMCDIDEAIAHSIRLVSLGADPPPPIAVGPAGGRVRIAGSLPMIGQVIVNLLKNALSASAAAGRTGAEVKVTLGEDGAEIAVADFGSGVSPEAAKSMFSPFAKSARGGMGLGLSICQRIAANLGGSLSWENAASGGAIFRFKVPYAREGHPA